MPTIWSLGYSGHTVESLIATLQAHGVDTLADIRLLPLSRKPGFSRKGLSTHLPAAGLSYVHLPELGTPRDIRRSYHETGDVATFRRHYEEHLEENRHALDQLASLAQRRKVAMMCVEADGEACHRWVVGQHLQRLGFDVVELPSPEA